MVFYMKRPSDFWEIFYFVMGLLGLVLIFLEIDIYRVTIIKLSIPIFIICFVGLITFFITGKNYNKTYSKKGFLFPLAQNIISWGFVASYVFMATNYYLADNNVKRYTFQIKRKSSLSASRRTSTRDPLVAFNYFGSDKELVFRYTYTNKVAQADSVVIGIKKGLLGFEIIDNYDVIGK